MPPTTGIPEISYVGRTEAELTDASVPYEVGISRFRELARGQVAGDSHGMLKLLVSPLDRELLGVHLFGTGATENVHVAQAAMGCGGTVDYLVDAVGAELEQPLVSDRCPGSEPSRASYARWRPKQSGT